ncbi:YcnI family protein [Nocardioides speluncae]|uniref:YcnI family copper-binding membrane protein n=1 Tax=Nocardioides speluncae TaxID=2670337 RepID=UPI000D69306D|nr:YcnI family protein [Nocardioides speluncae]
MTTRRTLARPLLRLAALPAAVGVLTLATAGTANAHVTITPSETAAGAYTVLTVSVPHGCDGSPTTKVAIQIPEPILSVTPTRNSFWTESIQMKKLATPVQDAHGNEVTERVATVTYTAKSPLPDGVRDTFELSLQLPETAGETLAFPTIQTCTKGQTGWTEVAADGGNAEELEHPAPVFVVTEADADDAHGEADEAPDEPDEAADDADDSAESSESGDSGDDSDDVSPAVGYTGLGAGVLGLLAGGAALLQVRRRQ